MSKNSKSLNRHEFLENETKFQENPELQRNHQLKVFDFRIQNLNLEIISLNSKRKVPNSSMI